MDLRGCTLQGGAPVPVDACAPSIESHLQLPFIEELLADCPDRELVSMLKFGVVVHAEVEPQIVIMPNLMSTYESTAGGIDAAADSLEELRRLGWYDNCDFIPFVPWRCAPRGIVVKKGGGLPRGIIDHGAPRRDLATAPEGEPVKAINVAAR